MSRISNELRRHWPEALLAALALLVLLALVVAGVAWVSGRGLLIELAALTLIIPGAFFIVRMLRRPPPVADLASAERETDSAADRLARQGINRLIESAQPSDIESIDAVQDLIARVIDEVSRAYHPDDAHARLRFSVPEALHLTEDVCCRLRSAIHRDIPALRHVELRLMVTGKQAYAHYTTAFNIYRILRLSNPALAIASELRQLMMDAAFATLGNEVKTRLAATLVREVGSVFMRLYNGEYREYALTGRRRDEQLRQLVEAEPLRILVAGQRQAGKSSLINALVGRDVLETGANPATVPIAVEHRFDGLGAVHLIEAPETLGKRWAQLIEDADLIIWVAASNRADRAADARALGTLRAATAANTRMKRTPVVLALTHADRLTPPMEWSPPYDVHGGARLKERNMRASQEAACAALDVPETSTAIIAVRSVSAAWNLEALSDAIAHNTTSAVQKRLERMTRKPGWTATISDSLRSVPGTVKRGYEVLKNSSQKPAP